MTHSRRWLIACLEGVTAADLSRGATPRLARELLSDHALPELRWPAGGACIDHLLELLNAENLRGAGVTVNLASLLLSPAWRSDDATLHNLGRRPGGPAEITCIRLREQARKGMHDGLGSQAHLRSLARMESFLDHACATLAHESIDLRCLVLTYAPLAPVQRCFDAERHLLANLPRSSRGELELCQTPALLRIRFTTNEAMDLAIATLERVPASDNGGLLSSAEATAAGIAASAQECIFAPRDGVAFHHRALLAAPSLQAASERSACALLPWATDGRKTASIEEVAEQFLAMIHVEVAAQVTPDSTCQSALDLSDSYPDLASLIEQESRKLQV